MPIVLIHPAVVNPIYRRGAVPMTMKAIAMRGSGYLPGVVGQGVGIVGSVPFGRGRRKVRKTRRVRRR